MNAFEKEVAKKFLSGLIPEIINNGGDERMVLQIVEHLVVGSLYILREVYHTDPDKAFELMRKAVEQRLADMDTRNTTIQNNLTE